MRHDAMLAWLGFFLFVVGAWWSGFDTSGFSFLPFTGGVLLAIFMGAHWLFFAPPTGFGRWLAYQIHRFGHWINK